MNNERQRLKDILKQKSILIGDFTLASGKKATYYIDARLTTLDAEGLFLTGKIFLYELIKDPEINGVGGPTMGADPIVGSIIAQSHILAKHLYGFLVRKEQKKHGTGKLIEGNLREGDRVVIVEDVVTTGGSVINAIKAVSNMGAIVKKVIVIVDREEGADQYFKDLAIEYKPLFRISELL